MSDIRCLIVDDEPLAAELLADYIAALPQLQLVGKCYSALEALTFLQHQQVELLFLDINLPRLSGLELVAHLTPSPKIIFVTAFAEHAVDSYELSAVDYLLKPVTFDRFLKAINKALPLLKDQTDAPDMLSAHQDFIFIKTGKTILQLQFESIWFIEGMKDYVLFHTSEGKFPVYKRMKDLEQVMPPDFLRVHHSYVINTRKIKKIEDHQVYIQEKLIPVSEKYREGFYELIQRRSI
jgi:two-component system LytT family response regulator